MAESKNVYAAEPLATGTCFVAPLGTDGPTDASEALDAAFIDLGHIGEDGYTETKDVNLEDKRNFGGRVVKTLQTEVTWTYQFAFLESLNANVLKAVYGASNVTVTAATTTAGTRVEIRKNAKKLPRQSWVIDTQDSELGAKYRAYLPEASVVEIGDVTIVHSDTIMYTVTLRAYEDAAGNNIYTWTDDGRDTTP